jgi:hypothetical protein
MPMAAPSLPANNGPMPSPNAPVANPVGAQPTLAQLSNNANAAPGLKAGGSVKGYAKGGGIEQRGKTKGQMFAKGGAVKKSIDGCATKGKTKGKIC